MKPIRNILLVFVVLLLSKPATAQDWEIGGMMGVANYFGDLNNNGSFEFIGPSAGVFVRKNIGYRFAYKIGLQYGRVAFEDASSDNPFQNIRNLSFKSNIVEFSNQIEINFFKYDKRKRENSFTPYLLIGISGFYFNPTTKLDDQKVTLQPVGTEGQTLADTDGKPYSRFHIAVPVGGGFKYSFNPFWALGIEGGFRFAFSDYIDDVSTTFSGDNSSLIADRSGEVGDPIGYNGKQRGDKTENDRFLFIGITISYTILKERCPKPSKIP